MKTIIETATSLSKFVFADDTPVDITSKLINVGETDSLELIIACMDSSNATLVEGVAPPADWFGDKYKYINSTWSINPDYIEPPADLNTILEE